MDKVKVHTGASGVLVEFTNGYPRAYIKSEQVHTLIQELRQAVTDFDRLTEFEASLRGTLKMAYETVTQPDRRWSLLRKLYDEVHHSAEDS